MLEARDAIQHLVQCPVATANEQMVVAVAYRLFGGLCGIALGSGDDDIQPSDAFPELKIDRGQKIRCGVGSRNGIDDELGLHGLSRLTPWDTRASIGRAPISGSLTSEVTTC